MFLSFILFFENILCYAYQRAADKLYHINPHLRQTEYVLFVQRFVMSENSGFVIRSYIRNITKLIR